MEECACPLDNTSLNFLILSKIIMFFFQQYFRDFKGFRNNISHLVITDGSAGERRAGMDMFRHFFSIVKQNKLESPVQVPGCVFIFFDPHKARASGGRRWSEEGMSHLELHEAAFAEARIGTLDSRLVQQLPFHSVQ